MRILSAYCSAVWEMIVMIRKLYPVSRMSTITEFQSAPNSQQNDSPSRFCCEESQRAKDFANRTIRQETISGMLVIAKQKLPPPSNNTALG